MASTVDGAGNRSDLGFALGLHAGEDPQALDAWNGLSSGVVHRCSVGRNPEELGRHVGRLVIVTSRRLVA